MLSTASFILSISRPIFSIKPWGLDNISVRPFIISPAPPEPPAPPKPNILANLVALPAISKTLSNPETSGSSSPSPCFISTGVGVLITPPT